jgi:short-subunit dehydrogenase
VQIAGAITLVTGASSGIGAATAEALSNAGARLILTGRDEDRLKAVAVKTSATAFPADLSRPGAPDELVRLAQAAYGRIDLLVCNAGNGWAGPIGDLPAGTADHLVAVNLLAPVHLARLLIPAMVARGTGHLVFVSSIAGATGVRHEAVYAATKAGLNTLAESLRYELADTGVGISVVLPGAVSTPFFSRRGRPYARHWPAPVSADRVARAIVSAAEHNRRVVYIPGWLHFPAWLHGLAPGTFRSLATMFS